MAAYLEKLYCPVCKKVTWHDYNEKNKWVCLNCEREKWLRCLEDGIPEAVGGNKK